MSEAFKKAYKELTANAPRYTMDQVIVDSKLIYQLTNRIDYLQELLDANSIKYAAWGEEDV